MKIENQIKKLLARYGKVSLPGRGVFLCVREGARVEDGKILPPMVRVVFEDRNAEMDRLLVETVMKEEKMEWKEACEYLLSVPVDVDDIVRKCDYMPQNFGLKAINMPIVRVMPVKWLDAKYAAVVAVAALMNVLIPFNGVRNDINEAGIDLSVMRKVLMPVAVDEENAMGEEEIVVEEMHYIIVVASFDTQEAAMRCITNGRTPGAMEVIEKDGRCRVCGMRFATYEEANNHIRENSLNAWVMKI